MRTSKTPRTAPPGPPAPTTVQDPPGGEDVSVWMSRRTHRQATRAAQARQTSGRRRLIDPTTCDREYSPAELEFMQAMHRYKQASGSQFPSWGEVLSVLRSLGYEQANVSMPTEAPALQGR